MQGLGLIATIIVGALAGWIAEKVMSARHGLLTNIVVGILGALVGNGLSRIVLGTTFDGWVGQMVTGAIGACLLIWAYRMLRR